MRCIAAIGLALLLGAAWAPTEVEAGKRGYGKHNRRGGHHGKYYRHGKRSYRKYYRRRHFRRRHFFRSRLYIHRPFPYYGYRPYYYRPYSYYPYYYYPGYWAPGIETEATPPKSSVWVNPDEAPPDAEKGSPKSSEWVDPDTAR